MNIIQIPRKKKNEIQTEPPQTIANLQNNIIITSRTSPTHVYRTKRHTANKNTPDGQYLRIAQLAKRLRAN